MSWFKTPYLALMTLVFAIAGVHIYERAIPLSDFVFYEKVKPTKAVFINGEPILMRSYFRVVKKSTLYYRNVLFCHYEEHSAPTYISTWFAERPGVEPVDYTDLGAVWQYNGEWPGIAADCFIQVSIKRNMDYAPTKEQVINSTGFRVLP